MKDTDDDRIDEALRGLPRSLQPPTDLWPGIAKRIEPSVNRRGVWLAAAAIAASVLAGAWWSAQLESATSLSPTVVAPLDIDLVAPAAPDSRGLPPSHGPEELIPEEAALRRATLDLSLAFARRRPVLENTQVLALLDENLGIVDDAIERSRAALTESPEDPHLQRALGQAYRHKIALLRTAAGHEVVP